MNLNKYTTLDEATYIMGDAFLGPEALQRHFGVKLSLKLWKLFDHVPFDTEVLQQCADTHVLVACGALSLMGIKQAQRGLFFYGQTGPWYEKDRFAKKKAKPGWYLVRKGLVPGSDNKSWAEQQALLGTNDSVPTTSVLVQAILLCHLGTKEHQAMLKMQKIIVADLQKAHDQK